MREAITNVVDTAIKYSPPPFGDSHSRGPRISDKDRQRMFDPFFRIAEGRSRDRGRDEFGSCHSTHGGTRMKRLVTICAALSLSFASAALAQDVPAEYQQVLTALGK
jgi:hypothetical protein